MSFSIQPSRFGMSGDRSAQYIEDLLARLRHTPGITSAAFTLTTSFSSIRSDDTYSRLDTPSQSVSAAQTLVSSHFFQTMGLALLAGRDFTEDEAGDPGDGRNVTIISRRLADTLFPDGSAVGSRLLRGYPKGQVFEIVGVVGDVRSRSLTDDPEPWAYSLAGRPQWGTIQVRSPLPAPQVMAAIREVARSLDPVVAPHDVETFSAAVDRALAEERLFARASTVFAIVAAVLAAIGIYGMMAGSVAERRKEFGIRLALGARSASVVGLVMRSSVTIAGLGLALGLASAAALGRMLESRLFGVSPYDPYSVAATTVAVLALTLIASLVPALRASRVDPVRSLRVDA